MTEYSELDIWMSVTRPLLATHHNMPVWSHSDGFTAAVGITWFNPNTDSDVVLSIYNDLSAELRDHDGDGDCLIPAEYHEDVATASFADGYEAICYEGKCVDQLRAWFISYCAKEQKRYYDKLRAQRRRLGMKPQTLKSVIEDGIRT